MGILNKVQKEQKVWARDNFGEEGQSNIVNGYSNLLEIISFIGMLSRTHLKESQGIRGTKEEHQNKALRIIKDIPDFLESYKYGRFDIKREPNLYEEEFGPYLNGTGSIFGISEEVGELAYSHLISDKEKIKDSVGDIIIYLADYCNRTGLDLEDIVSETWGHVKQRNWNKNPNNGKV